MVANQTSALSTVDDVSCSSFSSSSSSQSSNQKRSPNWTVAEIEALIQFVKENDERTILLNVGEARKGINATKMRYWQAASDCVNQASNNNRCWRQVRKKYKDYSYIAKSSMKAELEQQTAKADDEDKESEDSNNKTTTTTATVTSGSSCNEADSSRNLSRHKVLIRRMDDGNNSYMLCSRASEPTDAADGAEEAQVPPSADENTDPARDRKLMSRNSHVIRSRLKKRPSMTSSSSSHHRNAVDWRRDDADRYDVSAARDRYKNADYYRARMRIERKRLKLQQKTLSSLQNIARSIGKIASTVESLQRCQEYEGEFRPGKSRRGRREWSSESSEFEY